MQENMDSPGPSSRTRSSKQTDDYDIYNRPLESEKGKNSKLAVYRDKQGAQSLLKSRDCPMEKVVEMRAKLGEMQYLVRWEGYDRSHDSWVLDKYVPADIKRKYEGEWMKMLMDPKKPMVLPEEQDVTKDKKGDDDDDEEEDDDDEEEEDDDDEVEDD